MYPKTSLMQNPGSPGYAAGAAFAGRVAGGLPGLLVASLAADPPEGEKSSAQGAGMALRWVGQVAGAAGGAAMGAPEPLKTRAAIGAAIGGAIPVIGAPLAALGAYIATRPKARQTNPMTPIATVSLVVLGLATTGGLIYAGMKALEARDEKKLDSDTEADLDDWGWDLNRYELWGLGPVVGTDGKEYFYRIYLNLETDKYDLAYRGERESGGDGGMATPEEAEWCAVNRLPGPCFGYPG